MTIKQLKADIFGASASDSLVHASVLSGIVLVVAVFLVAFLTYGQHRAAGSYKISSIMEHESCCLYP